MDGVELVWKGKRTRVEPGEPLALSCLEAYGAPDANGWRDRLIHGDNLVVMTALQEKLAGQFALIYLDPPFFTGAEWKMRQTMSEPSLPAFDDSWEGGRDLSAYLQWLYDRLTCIRVLLSEQGCLYLHLNWQAAHYAKLLLDEIFGVERFQNEIVWCYREAINSKKRWNRKHDTILFYSKSDRFVFHCDPVREPYSESHVKKYRLQDENGPYRIMGRGITSSPYRSQRDLSPEVEAQHPELTYRHYLGTGTLPVDYWRIDIENQASPIRTGYPTQKPEALLERILLASSDPGDLIGDFCCGSGTALAVAARLGRRWIGCDAGPLAIHTARKRLLEAGTPFQVFALGTDEKERVGEPSPAACLEREGDAFRVRLREEALADIDAWAVSRQGEGSALPFCPDWWAVRTRRQAQLPAVSPAFPLPAAGRSISLWLAHKTGRTRVERLLWPDTER